MKKEFSFFKNNKKILFSGIAIVIIFLFLEIFPYVFNNYGSIFHNGMAYLRYYPAVLRGIKLTLLAILFLEDQWDGILIKALYCNRNGYDKLDFDILRSVSLQDGEYSDTHLILGGED